MEQSKSSLPSCVEAVEQIEGQELRVIVRLVGEVGLVACPQLERDLTRLMLRRPRLVVLDLGCVTLMSSLAMGALVAFGRVVKRNGGVARLAGAQRLVGESLKRARLDEMFGMYDTVEGAMGQE